MPLQESMKTLRVIFPLGKAYWSKTQFQLKRFYCATRPAGPEQEEQEKIPAYRAVIRRKARENIELLATEAEQDRILSMTPAEFELEKKRIIHDFFEASLEVMMKEKNYDTIDDFPEDVKRDIISLRKACGYPRTPSD